MSPDELLAGLRAVLGEDAVAGEVAHGVLTADVAPQRWVEAATVARDRLGCTFFDWLSAVDELDDVAVVLHVYAVGAGHHLQVRTRLPRDAPRLASLTPVFRGADWHERETHEMFGVVFDGHPGLVPLLLPDGFEGHPLRKDFVLASRVAKPWPGAKEPGESTEAPSRRATLPPGVPAPGTWPAAGQPVDAGPAPARPPGRHRRPEPTSPADDPAEGPA